MEKPVGDAYTESLAKMTEAFRTFNMGYNMQHFMLQTVPIQDGDKVIDQATFNSTQVPGMQGTEIKTEWYEELEYGPDGAVEIELPSNPDLTDANNIVYWLEGIQAMSDCQKMQIFIGDTMVSELNYHVGVRSLLPPGLRFIPNWMKLRFKIWGCNEFVFEYSCIPRAFAMTFRHCLTSKKEWKLKAPKDARPINAITYRITNHVECDKTLNQNIPLCVGFMFELDDELAKQIRAIEFRGEKRPLKYCTSAAPVGLSLDGKQVYSWNFGVAFDPYSSTLTTGKRIARGMGPVLIGNDGTEHTLKCYFVNHRMFTCVDSNVKFMFENES